MWETGISGRRDDTVAVVDGARSWSYADLAERVALHRDGFERDGVRPGHTVALLAEKSAQAIAATLALAEIGATVFIPPRALGAELRADLLARAAADYTVEADAVAQDPVALRATAVEPVHPAYAASRAGSAPENRAALVLSTSGSTGVPKLVPLPSPLLERFAGWAADAFGIGPGVRVLSYAPLNFDLSLLDVWGTLSHGGTTVLVPPDDAARPERIARILVNQSPDIIQAVPLLIRLLASQPIPPQPGVRHLILTGEAFPVEHWPWLRCTFPEAEIWNLYGCTETNDSFRHRVEPADIAAGRVPIGRPLPGVEVRIDSGARAGAGDSFGSGEASGAESGGATASDADEVGELIVSTPFQTPGYLRQGPADASDPQPSDPQPFVRLPGSDRVFYRTGDIVRRAPDGAYHLVDRISRIVKVNGVRTSLAEVERALADHPDVAEAVVFTVPDPVAGQVLHAAVRPRPDLAPAPFDTLALRGHCRRRLAAAAVPSRYHLLAEDLPRTSTGKPDRAKIRALLTEGAVP
ncbi:AMP-binding protein [Catenulispora yoronensis]